MFKPGVLTVLMVGSCFADIATWNGGGTEFNVNNKYDQHYSQHEASVNAARKGAAERLARISGSSGGTPCGSTICYSSSGYSDSDAETLGQGVVGFTSGGSGSSSSSSKYQSSSQQASINSAVPVYPVSGGTKSSYASSSQRHSASSVSAGQPVNYIHGTEGVKTRSNFGASSGSTVVQPIVVAAYPIGQESSQNAFASANRETQAGVYAVPVDSGNAYRSSSSYASASERDSATVSQPIVPVYTSGEQSSRYVGAGRQDNHQRYNPSNTYVVYSKPVPVQIYTNPARSSNQYAATEEQQSYSDRASHGTNYRPIVNYRPAYQPVYTGHSSSVERAEESHARSSELVAPVGVVAVPVVSSSSNRHEARQEDYSRKGSTYVPIVVNSGSTNSQYSTHDQRRAQSASEYSAYDQRRTNSGSSFETHNRLSDNVAPVAVVAAPAVSSTSNRHEDYSRKGSTYVPIVVNSGPAASKYSTQDQRRSQAASEYSVYDQQRVDSTIDSYNRLSGNVAPVPVVSSSSNRHEERNEDYSRKGSTYVPIAVNSGSTGSRYSTQDQRRVLAGSYVPIVPVGGSTSETSSKYAQEQLQSSSYVPVVVQPAVSTSSSSQYSAQQHRQRQQQQAAVGGTYYPGSTADYGSRYSASESQKAHNQHQVKGGSYAPYPITNDPLGRRFGATGFELGTHNDLGELMSESERLASLQAKNAYNGAVSGSSAIDTENRFDGNSDSTSAGGAGNAFQRTKSWSSSSKWASGQKYGGDGKVKSYSSLSTAESEQHNIDGKKTGYKAATTTLEDDGKVSTYSLHTP